MKLIYTGVDLILVFRKVQVGRHSFGIKAFLQASANDLGLRLQVTHTMAELMVIQVRAVALDNV